MHVGFLTTEYPPLPSGGIGTSIRNLARALVADGHRVTVLGWGHKADLEDEGVRVRFLGHTSVPRMGWLLNRQRVAAELNRLVRFDGLDIVEAHDWCGVSAGMRLRCPLVIRCHGSATYFADLLGGKVRRSVALAEGMGLRGADSVVAVSRFTAEKTGELFRLRKPVGVIHNGIDPGQFRPGRPEETDPGLVLYAGTLVRKKGILDLCRGFSRVAERNARARLLIVGRDSADEKTGSPSTWALCEELISPAARARVEYLGVQPYTEVQGFFRRAALCAFPSYAEACSLVWEEALACGMPVVGYGMPWAHEIVTHEETGLLTPAGDVEALAGSILRLLEDPGLRQRIGEAARRRFEEKFAAPVIAEQTLDWYRSVIRGDG